MEEPKFFDAVNRLYSYFNYAKVPPDETILGWFRKVKHIPDMTIDWICGKMEDDLDNIPRNFGKNFNYWWYRYQEANPNKIAKYTMTKCDECKSKGLLWYSIFDQEKGIRYQYCCVCGNCDNWRQHYGTLNNAGYIATKAELLEKGYRLEGPTKDFQAMTVSKSVSKLTEDMIKEPEEVLNKPKWCCGADPPNHTEDCRNNIANVPQEWPEPDPDLDDDIPF